MRGETLRYGQARETRRISGYGRDEERKEGWEKERKETREPKMCTAGQRVLLTITDPGPSFLEY